MSCAVLFSVGDCIHMNTGEGKTVPFIGYITRLFEKDGEEYLRARWFYRSVGRRWVGGEVLTQLTHSSSFSCHTHSLTHSLTCSLIYHALTRFLTHPHAHSLAF